eukprot:2331151-Rhodomonas_salina.1
MESLALGLHARDCMRSRLVCVGGARTCSNGSGLPLFNSIASKISPACAQNNPLSVNARVVKPHQSTTLTRIWTEKKGHSNAIRTSKRKGWLCPASVCNGQSFLGVDRYAHVREANVESEIGTTFAYGSDHSLSSAWNETGRSCHGRNKSSYLRTTRGGPESSDSRGIPSAVRISDEDPACGFA